MNRHPFSIVRAVVAALALACAGLVTAAGQVDAPSLRYQLPRDAAGVGLRLQALDAAKVLAVEEAALKGQPLRYAIMHKVDADAKSTGLASQGHWQTLSDGMRLWRLRVDAPGALSIDVAFRPFHLPKGAALYFTDAGGKFVRGPYTDADNPASGEFWTPFVPGDAANIEVLLPASAEKQLRLKLFNVNQAFRDIITGESPYAKSGSCNVDVVCSEGDNYREQIRAVARYSISGGLCSGQLINNTANDGKRLFITANHCISTSAAANSLVAYWNYESPTCRAPNSTQSGIPISVSGNSIAQPGGAVLRANHAISDTTVVELNTAIPAGVTPYWDGWDRSDTAKASAAVIHHPQGNEKRISFENNPLVLSEIGVQGVPGSRHWRINDWDVGTTEQGSSGSGLLSPEKRLIGVLSGGAAACSNNLEDYFGRLGVAWEGGGSASTRVRDWLDPLSTGAVTMAGRGSCNAPTVTLTKDLVNPSVDDTLHFTAAISGGTGPYTVRWDVDGDGVIDRTSAAAAQSVTLPVHYPVATSTSVVANVSDATGCATTASLAIEVGAPDIVASATAPVQICGDGDSVIEPGERWQLPVQLTNFGGDELDGAFAQFTRMVESSSAIGPPGDDFGYRVIDSRNANCSFQAIDMSAATIATRSGDDDGITSPLPVGGASPFRLYGRNVSQLFMSTNGYIATSDEDDGGDYNNVCGGFATTYDQNARLNVLNDDFVMQAGGSLRHQHFATCPRAPDTGAAQGCTVFQWSNLGRYVSQGVADGNAVFQAVLYDQSYEIVYQYLTADSLSGGSATIGIDNATQTDQLEYGCSTANQAPAGRAVCFFEPSAVPGSIAPAAITFEGGAQQSLPNLGSGQIATRNVPFTVPATAACGAPFGIRYIGTVDSTSSSNRSNLLYSGTIGNGGACQTTVCAASPLTPLAGVPKDGLFSFQGRSGNGIGLLNIAIPGGAVPVGAWFSGRLDRQPTWYLVNGAWDGNDQRADLSFFRFQQSAPGVFPTTGTQVGTGVLTHDGVGQDYVMSWTIDGISRMDSLVRTFGTATAGTAGHSGLWNSVGQSGWGVLYDDQLNGGNFVSTAVDYLYDGAGAPTWLLGSASGNGATMQVGSYEVHCPWCPNITDFGSTTFSAGGSQTQSFTDDRNGIFGSTINVPVTATLWNRSNLPIRLLTTPVQ